MAPIVLQEEVHLWVDADADAYSPYMSFAPKLQPWVLVDFPEIAHVDGTARIQTVTGCAFPLAHSCFARAPPLRIHAGSESSWIAKLLMELRARRGHAVLVNTSFNEKGLPILNRVSTAFALFDGHAELGGLLIEDWFFKQPG